MSNELNWNTIGMIGKNAIGTDGIRRRRMAIATDDGFTAEAMGWAGLADIVRSQFGPDATVRFAVNEDHYWKCYIVNGATNEIIVGVCYVTNARSLKYHNA